MGRWPSWVLPTAAGVTILLAVALSSHSELRLPPNAAITTVSITVDLDQGGHPVSPMLYGIFFEEVRRRMVLTGQRLQIKPRTLSKPAAIHRSQCLATYWC